MKIMKSTALWYLAISLSCGWCLCAAQAFDSGSTGADGPLVLTNGQSLTLALPPNGVFNFTTIDIAQSATLRFGRNELNTPVYLLATSNVNINGTIRLDGFPGTTFVSGQGGPGGFDGGNPPSGSDAPGDGYGPGGGQANTNVNLGSVVMNGGTYATVTSYSSTNRYGNTFLQPLVGGSGGGGSVFINGNGGLGGGGGGGGALLIAANSYISVSGNGNISAVGASGVGGGVSGGSGGGIRLVAPVIAGSGGLSATGGNGAGDGRIRLDTLDRTQMALSLSGKSSVGANMTIFPSPLPRLDVVEVAGVPIPVGTNSSVRITLPLNSSTNQTVKVRAADFGGPVTFEVEVIPDSGSSQRFFSSLDLSSTNQATATVNVVIPADVPCRVNAWTR